MSLRTPHNPSKYKATCEDLCVVFQRVYERGYMAGYNARKYGFKKAIQDVPESATSGGQKHEDPL